MSNSKINAIACDVLVVGAGVSGLFAAWRLLNNNPGLTVVVTEKLGRSGGRLQTTKVPVNNRDGEPVTVHDEEGGMRFVPETNPKYPGVKRMQHLWKLINDFHLETVPFVMGDGNNRYYARGRSFTVAESKANNNAIWSELYTLVHGEKGKSPNKILEHVMNQILAQNGNAPVPQTPEDWIKFRNSFTFKDSEGTAYPLNKWGFWAMLRQTGLSEEALSMLTHVMGFMGPYEAYINAGEGLQILFDFPSVKFFTLKNGFEALPTSLENEIISAGGQFIFNEAIQSIENNGSGITATGTKQTYNASKVILAIPKEPMTELARNSPMLWDNQEFMDTVNTVQNMELTKIGLYFKERWWLKNPNINILNGPNFTDLPMGSLYTFSQFPCNNDQDKNYTGPAAITQYTDYIRGNFWMELQNIGEMYQTEEFPANPPNTKPCSVNVVNEMMKQIKLVFGLDEDDPSVPMPVLSTYRVWGQGDYGYGYHQYKMNVDDLNDVYFQIFNPAENVYVCNEAWSPEQGWVEGALIMSDFMLILGFGLSPFVPGVQNPILALKHPQK
jgi:monoamine oxidase